MYLVFVFVSTPDSSPAVDDVRAALSVSATSADRLQHAYVESGDGTVVFCLFLQAPEEAAAVTAADQLCRRTMVALLQHRQWFIRDVRTGL
jgi:hypothetical protein